MKSRSKQANPVRTNYIVVVVVLGEKEGQSRNRRSLSITRRPTFEERDVRTPKVGSLLREVRPDCEKP